MTVALSPDGMILLEGACGAEDADQLLQLMLSAPDAVVDWRRCGSAHSAVLQVLMAAQPRVLGPPMDPTLAGRIAPALGLVPVQ